nr:ubiquitin fusion degradation protein 1 homolog [Ipomoea batatas]
MEPDSYDHSAGDSTDNNGPRSDSNDYNAECDSNDHAAEWNSCNQEADWDSNDQGAEWDSDEEWKSCDQGADGNEWDSDEEWNSCDQGPEWDSNNQGAEWDSNDHGGEWESNYYVTEWDSNDYSPHHSSRPGFDETYYCSSYSAVGDPSLETGGRVTLPASALPLLIDMDVSYPMQFRIASYGDLGGKSSHCGVLEFSAEEGFVYMPQCMMNNLGLNELDLVTVANVDLPKGDYLKLRPHTTEFLNKVKNPKEVLEATFREHSCLTAGDTVVVCYDGERFKVDVVETRPSDAVSVIDTDCNVDFDTPLDYKEPEKSQKIDDKDEGEEIVCFKPFTGIGRTLDGKVLETEKAESSSQGSLSKNGDKDRKEEAKKEDDKFQSFTGKKYTLGSS